MGQEAFSTSCAHEVANRETGTWVAVFLEYLLFGRVYDELWMLL